LPIITKHDKRFNDGGVHEAVETEALSQRLMLEGVFFHCPYSLLLILSGYAPALRRWHGTRQRFDLSCNRPMIRNDPSWI
jgi:hypothetical protein